MSFRVFLDTCVLYPGTLADLLLRVAEQGAYAPHWSSDVLSELKRNLAKIPAVQSTGAERRISQMERAFPYASVSGYADLIGAMTCAPEDRHALAAAVRADCQVLVTYNVRDFPHSSTEEYDVVVLSPGHFLLDQLDLHPRWVVRSLLEQSRHSSRPALSPRALLEALDRCGLGGFTSELTRRYPVNSWEAVS